MKFYYGKNKELIIKSFGISSQISFDADHETHSASITFIFNKKSHPITVTTNRKSDLAKEVAKKMLKSCDEKAKDIKFKHKSNGDLEMHVGGDIYKSCVTQSDLINSRIDADIHHYIGCVVSYLKRDKVTPRGFNF